LEFCILNANRTGEVLGARWAEIDLEAKVWTIPASRMKGRKEHRVPLSDRSIAILREAEGKKLRRHGDVVFPGRTGQMAPDTFNTLVERMQVSVVPHGFRASFRTWADDQGKDNQLAEFCLAHVVGDAAERAYRRSDVLERRRILMLAWSDYCTGKSR
jgi:integrase